MYKHIIWDFDGTLFDSYRYMVNSFQRALQDDGIEESYQNILESMKISVTNAINHYKKVYKINDEMIKRFCRYEKEINYELVKPYEHVQNICRMIYYSGRKNYLFTHRDKSALAYLEYYDLLECFCDFITEENKFLKKPKPDAIIYIIEKYNLKKEEVLMIGDRDIDIIAARNAGVDSCIFDPALI
ncbi:HAD-IA family hydrolase [Clostridium sp. UBA6640]|uniref:HAD-IA family hydrolase n=1 Tax=Clostridium sp. UBA6640 TaxID=1946370 RepID=UPI0025B9B624|nr:HAD-IA family hydrolase [Clostridium sp. UBA6640]